MNKNKTITIITALIIVLGLIITLTAGFNVEMITKEHKELHLDIGKDFKIEDIKNITKEVFEGKKVEIQKVEAFEDQVLISVEEITDEQKNNVVSKINEKYGTEIKAEETTINTVPKANLKDYIIPHIMEFVWATVLVVLYMCIRYKKLKVLTVLVQTILGIAIAEAFAFSILAITRIPVGANLVAVMFVIYAVAILALTYMFENNLQKIKLEESKE
ncbi:MAG: hypothetical protein IKF38_00700 [Clostridia bacterium]|nr:hypothetical protein [Clostridia bacterium]